jgi:hypothetical protein
MVNIIIIIATVLVSIIGLACAVSNFINKIDKNDEDNLFI